MARSRLLIGAGLAVTLVACDAIIGLSDFKKGECSGGGACLDDGGPTITDAGSDADASPDSGRSAEPVSWARWPMPNYPGAEAGADAGLSSTDNGATVSDVTRKLVWQANGDATQVDFSAAEAKCAAIGPNSDSWRLPKRIELVTLLDFSQSGTLINPLFKNIAIGPVWTSSESRSVATVTTQFWVVSFGDGTVTTVEGSQPAAGTLCVKAQ